MNRSVRFPLVAGLILGVLFGPIPSNTYAQDAPPSPATASAPAAQASASATPTPTATMISIPGPLRSFLRMAAISQKVSPDEIAPLLARNIFLLGYEG
ncbi:MAG: hypothetical protein JO119_02690, partial [Acidobacteria bacterium]|nr:hypothetical protein [Acidobacteriota bacterium]